MELDSKVIFEILVEKKISGLYHANTVRTSKTFLEQAGLLSRKYIEDKGLKQTIQKSDEIDKRFGIWDHVFLDALNVGSYFRTYNNYGPILFKFSIELLNHIPETVRITKKNPIYWKDNDQIADRYFLTIDEFNNKFKKGNKLDDGGNHITLTTINGFLPFGKLLVGIQIDDPGINFVADNGVENSLCNGIIEFFSKDFELNNFSNKYIHIQDHWPLKYQYKFLYKTNPTKFWRLFSRHID